MGKSKIIWIPIAGLLLLIGFFNQPSTDATTKPEQSSTARPTQMPIPTETPTPTPAPTKTTKPAPVNYWASGLKVEDISLSTSRNCTFDMCVILKLTALKTCSSITLEGIVYNYDGDEVDDFSDELPRLARGKSRVVEFGTDATEDWDSEVELDGWTCWK
jgi:hypothetical protein